MNIFLDDVRLPTDMGYMNNAAIYFQNEFKVVKNVDEFKKALDSSKEIIEIISFDHDLNPNHYNNLFASIGRYGTGGEALQYFINWVKLFNIDYEIKIMFHTMNFHGLMFMEVLFDKQKSMLPNIKLIQKTPSRYLAR